MHSNKSERLKKYEKRGMKFVDKQIPIPIAVIILRHQLTA